MSSSSQIPAGFGRLCGTAGFAGLGVGAVVPLISTHLAEQGSDDVTAGALATLYFAAQGAAALLGRRLPARIGGVSILTLGLLVAALSTVVFELARGFGGWAANRAFAGAAMGLYMTAAQLQVMQRSRGPHQAKLNGLYALCFGGGFSLGPSLCVFLYGSTPAGAFWGAAAAFVASAAIWATTPSDSPRQVPNRSHSPVAPVVGSLLPLFAVMVYGLCEASVFALFALYWLDTAGQAAGMGTALGLFGVGSLVATLPLTSLADRIGVRTTLALCGASGAVVLLALTSASTPWVTQVMCGLAGASVGPCFALALSLLAQESGPRIQASSRFTTAFSLGSVAGPLLSTSVIHYFGIRQVFLPSACSLAAVAAAAATLSLLKRTRSAIEFRPQTPGEVHE